MSLGRIHADQVNLAPTQNLATDLAASSNGSSAETCPTGTDTDADLPCAETDCTIRDQDSSTDSIQDVRTRDVMVCATCRVSWPPEAQQPPCTDPQHEHRRHEIHLHDDPVELPNGNLLHAVSFDPIDPYRRANRPDHGLYLDPHWQPPWPHDHLAWPDFGVPDDPGRLREALTDLLNHVANGELAEIGCLGGHGRTGTALACAAILTGEKPDAAVAWVRSAYCSAAVETAIQEEFIKRSKP